MVRRSPHPACLTWALLCACGPTAARSPADLDATAHAPPVPPCEGHPFAMRVSGVVRTPDGAPVVGAPIGTAAPWSTPRTLTHTRPDGTYDLRLDGPTMLAIQGYRGLPSALCAAIPKQFAVEIPEGARVQMNVGGMDFLAAPTCRIAITLEADGGAPLATTAPIEVSAWVDGERVHHDALPRPEELILALPCDAQGVAFVGGGAMFAGAADGPSCGLPKGTICLPGLARGEGLTLNLRPTPAPQHEVVVHGPDGAALPGATVRTLWGTASTDAEGKVQVTLPDPDALWTVEAPGHLSRTVPGTTSEVRLDALREVEVRCAGAPGDRCPGRVTVETDDGERICAARGDVHVCETPTADATIRHGDARVLAPTDVGAVWVDYRGIRGAIDGAWPGAGGPVFAVRTSDDGVVERALDALGLGGGPSTRFARATPDADGRFRLAPLSEGTWTIYAPASPEPAATVVVGSEPVSWTR